MIITKCITFLKGIPSKAGESLRKYTLGIHVASKDGKPFYEATNGVIYARINPDYMTDQVSAETDSITELNGEVIDDFVVHQDVVKHDFGKSNAVKFFNNTAKVRKISTTVNDSLTQKDFLDIRNDNASPTSRCELIDEKFPDIEKVITRSQPGFNIKVDIDKWEQMISLFKKAEKSNCVLRIIGTDKPIQFSSLDTYEGKETPMIQGLIMGLRSEFGTKEVIELFCVFQSVDKSKKIFKKFSNTNELNAFKEQYKGQLVLSTTIKGSVCSQEELDGKRNLI